MTAMTSRDFCYWLQGFFELRQHDSAMLDQAQVAAIKAHLAMVFIHEIDPSMGPPAHQAKLDDAHAGKEEEKPVDPRVQAAMDALKGEIQRLKNRPHGDPIMRC